MTIDAIGCQIAIADKIIEHQADYLLALKAINQLWKLKWQTTSVLPLQKNWFAKPNPAFETASEQ